MTDSFEYISVDRSNGIDLLKVEVSRLSEFEVAEALGREMIAAVGQAEKPQVIVDMSQLEYMASVGYGPFVSLRIHIRKTGGRLVLCCLTEVVHEIFTATRLLINPSSTGSRFEHAPNVEDAITMLKEAN